MSLRTRLLAGLLAVAVVLVVVLAVITRTTEANLLDQVDDQLIRAVEPVRGSAFDFDGTRRRGPAAGRRPNAVGNDLTSLYVGLVADDAVLTLVSPGLRNDATALPDLDVATARDNAGTGTPFTVAATGSDLRYRALAYDDARAGAVIVLALPIDTVDAAVSDLIAVEAAGAIAIAIALVLVAGWVIRLGIRPIKAMTAVAAAIGAGDLSHRVPETDSTTEAGELGAALNTMLASIEHSFEERQQAEARLRQFVADASHELRTPVATIRGYAELYRAGGLDERTALDDAMRRTEQEAVRMGGLVDDLLHLARLDQGRPLDPGRVDLAAVARDAANDARAVDPDRAIDVDVALPVIVEADEAMIRQVVANLMGNALVHTPPGTAVTVRARSGPAGACIEVSDDGPGMTPEVASRVFERFFRADPSRSRHRGGSGLGLAIVDATVRAHGGSVDLETDPAGGTTVRITLP